MIKYNIFIKKSDNLYISKEKLVRRKNALNKMKEEIRKQVKINKQREIKSLEYIKNRFF